MGKFRLLAGALIGCLFLTSGCGGGDSTSSLTRGEFVRQGNAICEKQRDKRNAAIAAAVAKVPKGKALSAEAKKEILVEVTPYYEQAAEELKELPAPEGDEEKVETLIEAMERAAEETLANIDTAIHNSTEYTKPNELNEDYGLTGCMI